MRPSIPVRWLQLLGDSAKCVTLHAIRAYRRAAMTLMKKPAQRGDNLLEQVADVFAKYVDAKPHYIVGLSLWALHTHAYNRYDNTPRLSILSPVKNCGKSTVLDILSAMAWNPKKISNLTEASILRLAGDYTLLLDEVDNYKHAASGC